VTLRQEPDRRAYLLQELRCAALRARLWQADIEAVGLALKGGLIHPEQAIELLSDCDALHLVAPPSEERP
jgi:hypothetical protein